MVLVTRKMTFARDVADCVVFMHDGIVMEECEARPSYPRATRAGDAGFPGPLS